MKCIRGLLLAAATCMTLAACGGGGGSPGGGITTPPPPTPPVPPPPPPPPPPVFYQSSCTATPGALACARNVAPIEGAFSSLLAAPIGPFVLYGALNAGITADNKGTSDRADDTYVLTGYDSVSPTTVTFGSLQDGVDLFGNGMKYTDAPGGVRMETYETPNARSGGLDYVVLGKVTSGISARIGAPSYFAMGHPMAPIYIPTAGNATFSGATYGGFQDTSGSTYSTTSNIAVAVNFASGSISGATSNFKAVTSAGSPHTPSIDLNFTFTANRAAQPFRPLTAAFFGSASNSVMQGQISGYFFGEPNGPPSEIGLSYALDAVGTSSTPSPGASTRPILFGIAGLKADVAPPVIAPPPPSTVYSPCSSGYEIGCGAVFRASGAHARNATLGSAFFVESARSFFVLDIDGKSTPSKSDDVYRYSIPDAVGQVQGTFIGFTTYSDALGTARYSTQSSPSVPNSRIDIFEVQGVLESGLDYLQLGRITGNLSLGSSGTTYFAHGREANQLLMPSSGSATFRGGTRGDYIDASGTTYRTASDVALTVDFAGRTLSGSTANFRAVTVAGANFTPPSDLNFTFNATLFNGGFSGIPGQGVGFTGTASNTTMQGRVDGVFAGRPDAAPNEIGMTYNLTTGGAADRGPLIYGAGGLRRTN